MSQVKLFEQIVCDTCRMKIPSETHAKAHHIVRGHETRTILLGEDGYEYAANGKRS